MSMTSIKIVASDDPTLANPPTIPGEFTSWEAYEAAFAHPAVRTAYVWGKHGTGKSYTAMTAGLAGRNRYAVTLTPETPAAELRGHWLPKGGGEFHWQDGIIVKAMRDGSRLVINELSHASEDVMAILYPVLESRETAQITLPTMEVITPTDGFQVICTDNYGPDSLPLALKDRFNVTIHVESIHPNALLRIDPKWRPAAEATSVLEGDRYISVRSWMSFQELEKDFGPRFAAQAVFGVERAENIISAYSLGSVGINRK